MTDAQELGYNCRMKLTENAPITSTQIGLAYQIPRTLMYEKAPYPNLPVIRTTKSYKPGTIYTPHDGLNTTYGDTYRALISDDSELPSKLPKQPRPYSKFGSNAKPLTSISTEYRVEYLPKEIPLQSKRGLSIEQETSCPMVTTGRDEREPLPITQNYYKYLDIYLSTSRLTHRAFTLQEQRTIAMKDIVTSQETMDIPKGRGFGCKFPAFPGQDLDNRDKKMIDKVLFHTETKLRYIPKGMPKVPNYGSESETQAAYVRPDGAALSNLFSKFFEYPQVIGQPTAKQTLSAPAMYSTESSAINNHKSPQAVV